MFILSFFIKFSVHEIHVYILISVCCCLESIYLEEKPTLWSVKGRTGLDDDEASMDMIPV